MPIAIGCWRGRTNVSVMVNENDCKELLERVSELRSDEADEDVPIPEKMDDAPIPETNDDAPIPETNDDVPIPETNGSD